MYYIYYHYSAYCIYRICFDCNLAFHHDKPLTCCLKLCYLHVHKTFSIWLWYERLKLKSSMSLWLTCSLNTIELSTCNGVLKHQYLEFPKQLEVLVVIHSSLIKRRVWWRFYARVISADKWLVISTL